MGLSVEERADGIASWETFEDRRVGELVNKKAMLLARVSGR